MRNLKLLEVLQVEHGIIMRSINIQQIKKRNQSTSTLLLTEMMRVVNLLIQQKYQPVPIVVDASGKHPIRNYY